MFTQRAWSLLFFCSSLLLSTFISQVLKVLYVKFIVFPWEPLLFSYFHLSVPYCFCGFRLAVPDLQFYRHPLCKKYLIPVHSIIIRRLQNEFDNCHLSLLNYLDQKIRRIFFFSHLFQYISTTNTLQLTTYNTQNINIYDKGFYNWSENYVV